MGQQLASAGRPRLYLTYDDGPSAYTAAILSALESRGAHATFFIVCGNVVGRTQLVRRAIADGDTVQDHTWSHPSLTALTFPAARGELQTCRDFITRTTGVAPRYWRPPYKNWAPYLVSEGQREGTTMMLWDIDTGDWTLPGTASIVDTVLRYAYDGAVVSLHDGGGNRSQTVAATQYLVNQLTDEGWDLAAL